MIRYPALFKKESNGEYSVSFIDIPNAITCGSSISECKKNAYECLNAIVECDLEDGHPIPSPSKVKGHNIHYISLAPNVSFALMLRQMRGKKSQKAVAKQLGMQYQTYQRLEDPRKANPTLKTIEKISKVFGCHFNFSLY